MDPITRRDAFKTGKRHYFTGRPCMRGHLAPRFVTNGGCTECQNWRIMPVLAAPNVGMPPSPYAFDPSVPVTPGLVSYVHSRILRDVLPGLAREFLALRPLVEVSPHAEPHHEASAVLGALDKHRALYALPADRDLAAWRKAGWTDDQLVAKGYAEWRYHLTPASDPV